MTAYQLILYLLSFFALWIGAGLIVKAVDGFSSRLKLSSFSVSFFLLGVLTSVPEFAVGMASISQRRPEIFVGNLLGGTATTFLLVIPVLAILGKGIKLTNQLDRRNLIFSLLVAAAPAFFTLDGRVSTTEGITLIFLYVVLIAFIELKKKGILSVDGSAMRREFYSPMDILKLVLGIAIVIISSRYAVTRTILFSNEIGVSPFIVSLILLSFGTNLPELSLAVRSIIEGKRDIAMGDYLGSAATNSLLFGIFTLISGGEVLTSNHFFVTFMFVIAGLGGFYYFVQSEKDVSRKEGIVLIIVYILFIAFEASRL